MNDTIYRRYAIQALVDTEEIKGFAYRMLEDRLMEIPSADKQQVDGAALISAMSLGYGYGIKANRLQGEWLDIGTFSHSYKCSVCGRTLFNITVGKNHVAKYYPYCHCGARMKGTDDEGYYI